MSRKKKALCVVLVLALVLGGACFWQRENLRALEMSLRLTQDELGGKLTEQQSRTEQAAKDAGVDVRGLTDEEKQALRGSDLTREELIERIANSKNTDGDTAPADTADSSDAAAPADSEASAPAQDDGEQALRDELARCIAEIYVMEAEYTSWLEDANQSAIDEYVALPAEKQTTGSKYEIGMRYLSLALEKEKECDARMAELEETIRSLLTQLGESTALVDEIQTAYTEKKATMKAYYLSIH